MMPHPFLFTWSEQSAVAPVEMVGGSGSYFETGDGARWLDFGSLSYQASLGHGHPRIIEAIQQQAAALPVVLPNAVFPAKKRLAERLLKMAPDGFTKVFFTLGGSEATENAVKISRMVTGRYKTVSRYRSYHGATMGAISLTGDWRRPLVEPGVTGAVHAMDCYCDHCPFGQQVQSCKRECASHIDEVLALEANVAAVIVEPVPGANGVLVPPSDYLAQVRAACNRHGALLIADEVLTGFGRTGRAFAYEHYGVVPDLITVAKALTGGYSPLGAVLVHESAAEHFRDNVLACGLTNYAHPLGCAAANAALDVYEEDGLFDRARVLGTRLLAGAKRVAAAFPDRLPVVRGIGLLCAIEVDADTSQWDALTASLAARHLYLHVDPRRRTVIFAPPLNIEEEHLERGLELFAEAAAEAFGA